MIHLNVRKNFCTVGVAEHRSKSPREVVDSPLLEIFKTHLDAILCNLFQVNLIQRSPPSPISVILFRYIFYIYLHMDLPKV